MLKFCRNLVVVPWVVQKFNMFIMFEVAYFAFPAHWGACAIGAAPNSLARPAFIALVLAFVIKYPVMVAVNTDMW